MHFKIKDRIIGDGYPTYIIAEMSANHSGDLDTAIEIIHAAKRSGADAIKLQTYTADTITLNSNKEDFTLPKDSPWHESKNLHALYDEAHTPWSWHPRLFEEAKKLNLDIFSAPFDVSAVDFLAELDCPIYKIASPEINDLNLIKKCAQTGKPIILSTGLASSLDIERAIKTLTENGCQEFAFLKCTTSYPAPLEDANLAAIPILKKRYHCLAGVSDHTEGSLVPALSVAMGANIIEKHFKLNNSQETVDSFFSLTEDQFSEMVGQVRNAEKTLGSSIEITNASKKNLRGRRSLYLSQNIKKGESFTPHNVQSVRPSFGMSPRYYEEIIGKAATQDIEKGERLNVSHIQGFSLPKVKIFCDAGQELGTGHVRRSISLAQFLNQNDIETKLFPLSTCAQELIPSSLLDLDMNTNIAIIDTPLAEPYFISQLKRKNVQVIALDLDREIGQEKTISVFEHSKLSFPNRQSGFDFIIIKKDIKKLVKGQTPTSTKNVLVVLGGSDLKNESSKVANRLNELNFNVTLVIGALAKITDNISKDVTVYREPDNFPKLMQNCDWAISNGGGCLFELLYLNKPVHVMPQTQAEENIANHLKKTNIILGTKFNQIISYSLKQLQTTFKRSQMIVDGHGPERIQGIIEDVYNA